MKGCMNVEKNEIKNQIKNYYKLQKSNKKPMIMTPSETE